MALVFADRVTDTSTTTGTTDFALSGTPPGGFQAWSVIGNTNTAYYTATDGSGNWETGIGTYSSTGPTLARTTVLASSNSNAKVSFPAGTKTVFNDPAAAYFVIYAAGIAAWLASPTSANLATAVTDETGTGALVFAGSPALTGSPTAPTQTALDSSTKLATTAYTDNAVAAGGGQPIPTSSTFAVGTFATGFNNSGANVNDGSTLAGSNVGGITNTAAGAQTDSTTRHTGTWKNVSGTLVGHGAPTSSAGSVGYFVRTV